MSPAIVRCLGMNMTQSNRTNRAERFVKSFGHAYRGLTESWKSEVNIRIHLFIALLMILQGVILSFDKSEWIITLLCIGLVITAELFNTAIEGLCDIVQSNQDSRIGRVKDISSAAVLMISMSAAIVGSILILSKILVV